MQKAAPPPPQAERPRRGSLPSLLFPLVACLTLGLAPFSPEPHVVEKLRWVLGGAEGMALVDWFDLAMHSAPWLWLAGGGVTMLRGGLPRGRDTPQPERQPKAPLDPVTYDSPRR